MITCMPCVLRLTNWSRLKQRSERVKPRSSSTQGWQTLIFCMAYLKLWNAMSHTAWRTVYQNFKSILFIMKMKLNLHNTDLDFRFGVSEATVSRIFDKWLCVADCRLKPYISWPDQVSLQQTMPQAFFDSFGANVATVIDCFEIKIERPSSYEARSETWSQYKTLLSSSLALLLKMLSPSSQKVVEGAAVISISQSIVALSITCVLLMLCLLTEASISVRVLASIARVCMF